jgi:hypothetical protein
VACNMAEFWQGTGCGLDHWRSEVDAQHRQVLSAQALDRSSRLAGIVEDDDNEEDDEEGKDEGLQEALRLSRETYYGSTNSNLPTPFVSPLEAGRPRHRADVITIDDDDADEDDLYTRPPKKSRSQLSPRNRNSARTFSATSSDDEGHTHRGTHRKDIGSNKQQGFRPRLSGGMGLDQLLGRSNLGQRSAAPTSDTIDGRM